MAVGLTMFVLANFISFAFICKRMQLQFFVMTALQEFGVVSVFFTIMWYMYHELPQIQSGQNLSEDLQEKLETVQLNFFPPTLLISLLLQIVVGSHYVVYIFPMVHDYYDPDHGLVPNHITRKEEATRRESQSEMRYRPGHPTLKRITAKRKRKYLYKFFFKRKIPQS